MSAIKLDDTVMRKPLFSVRIQKNADKTPINPTFKKAQGKSAEVKPSSTSNLTLSDLPEVEKAKVARLVDRLVSLAKEHEDLIKVP